MPNINIFKGSVSARNMLAEFSMTGEGSRANLTLSYPNNYATARFETLELSLFKETKLYIENQSNAQSVNLFNIWHKIITPDTIALFASEDEPVILFTSDNKPERDLEMLVSNFAIADFGYFNELKFSMYLQDELNLSFDDFRIIMNPERIQLIQKYECEFRKLIKFELTPSFLSMLDIRKFEEFLKHANDLGDALQFVTLPQILGLSHQPPIIKTKPTIENQKLPHLFSTNLSINDFDYQAMRTQEGSKVSLIYKKKAKLEVFSRHPEILGLRALEKNTHGTTPIKIINDWYPVTYENEQKEKNQGMLFCKSTNILIIEEYDFDFPMKELEINKNFLPLLSDYHAEVYFSNQLKERGYSINQLYQVSGVTQEKLTILLTHTDYTMQLIDMGFNLTNIAKVDISRIDFVLKNFEQAKKAFLFVDARELFGLNAAMLTQLWKLPQEKEIPNNTEQQSNCLIV